MVPENDVRTCWSSLFMFPNDYLHPLEIETRVINSGREKSEEVNSRYEEVIKN